MKKFCYRFLIALLAVGILMPTYISRIFSPTKAFAAVVDVINEGFNAGTTAPPGWTFTGITDTYTGAGNYGTGSPSLKFDSTGDQVTTPSFLSADSLSFWNKGVGTNDVSSLLIEYYKDGSWTTLSTLNPIPTPGQIENYSLISGTTQLRFTYTKSAGNLAFDDVVVTYNDIIKPIVTGVSEAGIYNTDVTIDVTDNIAVGSITLNGAPIVNGSTISSEDDYQLIAKDTAGNETEVNFQIDKTPPTTAPVVDDPTVIGGDVNLTWSAVIDNVGGSGVAGYNIYRASSPYEKINTSLVTATNYIDIPGIGIFNYKVTAVDAAGNESGDSNIVAVDFTQLPAPINLVAVAGDGEVSLFWDAVAGGVSYNVYYKKVTDADFSPPVNVINTSTKITNLENGVKYNIIVRVLGSNGIESADAWVDATPVATKVVLASAPVVTVVEVTQPATPVETVSPEVTNPTVTQPITTSPIEEGKIKGEEDTATEETENINWTPWIILFILIILAGAATGGYFYWFGREEEEEIVTKEVVEKKSAAKKTAKTASKKNKRW